jgi:hypothetical protein
MAPLIGGLTTIRWWRKARAGRKWRGWIGWLWSLAALALVAWGLAYIIAGIENQPGAAIIYGAVALLALMVALLFYGEGCDVAVARLYDKDVAVLPPTLRDSFAKMHSNLDATRAFIAGRQFLVVTAIVVITLDCGFIAGSGPWSNANSLLLNDLANWRALFAFLFPVFFAMWFAQLPSKFIAHDSPLQTCNWILTRALIKSSIWVGSFLQLAVPSLTLKNFVERFQPRSGSELKPSRRHYYVTSATLRDGKGLESVEIDMEIGPDGAIRGTEEYTFRAYAPGFHFIELVLLYEAPIAEAQIEVIKGPPETERTLYPPERRAPVGVSEDVKYYPYAFKFELASSLPVGDFLVLREQYTTEAQGMKATSGSTDRYRYEVFQIPTGRLTFKVHPMPEAKFKLMDGHVTAHASDDRGVNEVEAKRVDVARVDRGYVFTVDYPLLSTEFSFNWKVS